MKFSTSLPLIALAIASSSVRAETISCSFTEPFFATEYNTKTRKLKITTAEDPKPTRLKKIKMKEVSSGVFELRTRSGDLVQKLVLNGLGSDGMSDIVFPYEGYWYELGEKNTPLVGGCSSTSKPVSNPEEETLSTPLIDEGDDIRLHTSTEVD